MKSVFIWLIPSLCFLLNPASLPAGSWGPQGCSPVGDYVWREIPADSGRIHLFHDGVQVGGYDLIEKYYRPFDVRSRTWGEPTDEPPVDLPAWVKPDAQVIELMREDWKTSGVAWDKISSKEKCSFNGREITCADAMRIMGSDGRLPDDAKHLRLTVIGSDSETKKVLHDLDNSPDLAEWKKSLVIQSYPPDHWAVAKAGFATGGKPTIYLQSPDGKVLHRQDDYSDGTKGLATALRRADPSYDAGKDSDARKLPMTQWQPWVVVGLAVVLVVLMIRTGERK